MLKQVFIAKPDNPRRFLLQYLEKDASPARQHANSPVPVFAHEACDLLALGLPYCGEAVSCKDIESDGGDLSDADLQKLFLVSRRITGKIIPQETISNLSEEQTIFSTMLPKIYFGSCRSAGMDGLCVRSVGD